MIWWYGILLTVCQGIMNKGELTFPQNGEALTVTAPDYQRENSQK